MRCNQFTPVWDHKYTHLISTTRTCWPGSNTLALLMSSMVYWTMQASNRVGAWRVPLALRTVYCTEPAAPAVPCLPLVPASGGSHSQVLITDPASGTQQHTLAASIAPSSITSSHGTTHSVIPSPSVARSASTATTASITALPWRPTLHLCFHEEQQCSIGFCRD